MGALSDPAVFERILARVDRLRPDAKREWDKIDAAQAMAHCALALEAATAARCEQALIGKVSGEDWGRLQHKHADHHLRHLGV